MVPPEFDQEQETKEDGERKKNRRTGQERCRGLSPGDGPPAVQQFGGDRIVDFQEDLLPAPDDHPERLLTAICDERCDGLIALSRRRLESGRYQRRLDGNLAFDEGEISRGEEIDGRRRHREKQSEKKGATLLTLLLLVAACQGKPRLEARPPDVVLLVADTLRADLLGGYGDPHETSPHLDRWSRRGVTFTRVESTAPWTLPAMASALSGRPPDQTGVLGQLDTVAKEVPLVASEFTAKGYHTAAVSANYLYVSPKAGLARGFDRFDVLTVSPDGKLSVGTGLDPFEAMGVKVETATAPVVSRRAGTIYRRLPKPRFLYVHFMDTHWHYQSTLPPLDPRPAKPKMGHIEAVVLRVASPTAKEGRYVVWLYRNAVRGLDYGIGMLLARLRLGGSTRITLTADHGEELWDHRGLSHGHTLYQELLHVPAIASAPAGRLDKALHSLAGLRRFLLGGVWPVAVDGAASVRHVGIYERSILAPPFKLVQGDRGRCLYRMDEDPRERYDVAADYGDATDRLQSQLDAQWERPVPSGARLDATIEELRALGYVP